MAVVVNQMLVIMEGLVEVVGNKMEDQDMLEELQIGKLELELQHHRKVIMEVLVVATPLILLVLAAVGVLVIQEAPELMLLTDQEDQEDPVLLLFIHLDQQIQ